MTTTMATLAPEIAAELPPEPYPGLRPFEPHEWAIFFGREPMTDEVIARLARQHLVVVHGASGSGKSSLVRAGVLPWLGLDHARSGKAWKTAVARPSGGPLRNIARRARHPARPPTGRRRLAEPRPSGTTAWPSAAPSWPTSTRRWLPRTMRACACSSTSSRSCSATPGSRAWKKRASSSRS